MDEYDFTRHQSGDQGPVVCGTGFIAKCDACLQARKSGRVDCPLTCELAERGATVPLSTQSFTLQRPPNGVRVCLPVVASRVRLPQIERASRVNGPKIRNLRHRREVFLVLLCVEFLWGLARQLPSREARTDSCRWSHVSLSSVERAKGCRPLARRSLFDRLIV